jgi:hypothetical protein
MLTHDYKPTLRSHTHWQAAQCNRTDQSLPKSMPAQPHGGQESTGYNSGFKKLAVQWLIEHSTSHQHLWWLDSFVLRNRQLPKPAKR